VSDLTKRKSTFLSKLGRFQPAICGKCREDVLRKDWSVGVLAPECESTNSKKCAAYVFDEKSAKLYQVLYFVSTVHTLLKALVIT
jgi:uncharacterized CHY-type Zn-finger protein